MLRSPSEVHDEQDRAIRRAKPAAARRNERASFLGGQTIVAAMSSRASRRRCLRCARFIGAPDPDALCSRCRLHDQEQRSIDAGGTRGTDRAEATAFPWPGRSAPIQAIERPPSPDPRRTDRGGPIQTTHVGSRIFASPAAAPIAPVLQHAVMVPRPSQLHPSAQIPPQEREAAGDEQVQLRTGIGPTRRIDAVLVVFVATLVAVAVPLLWHLTQL